MTETKLRIPIDLQGSEKSLDLKDVSVEFDDSYKKPFGCPGMELFQGFVIDFISSIALVGFLKGLGIDLDKPFVFIGRKVKSLFNIQNKSIQLFGKDNAIGYLKLYVNLGGVKLCFYFYRIEKERNFLNALKGVNLFVDNFLGIISDRLKSKNNHRSMEIIYLKWCDETWKIDEFFSNLT
ncbi:MAG: hypothetical protein WC508_05295 [Patescibacteria group bacterium]